MRTLCFLTLLVLLNVGDSLKCHLISYGSLADTNAITTSTSLQECPIGANSCVKTIDYSRNVFSKQCQIGNCTTSTGISQAPANCFNSSNNGAIYSTCCCYGDGCNSAPMSAPALISAFLFGIFAFYVLS
ncbi:unnamed protein product [Caenorhabditis angaria]|uniref:UPAR/Ly6 domain-containing protein n=1 Tax=Caenorhabditis angaria TaxID=860376 RepID=A0A9P1N672_9PELO|nr:unnamed protein product [Caenorhabditis angaria]